MAARHMREDRIDALVRAGLGHLRMEERDVGEFRDLLREEIACEDAAAGTLIERVARDLALVEERMARLTDALLDGLIDKTMYEECKAVLIARKIELRERQERPGSTFWRVVAEKFELGFAAQQGYEMANDDEKRDILKSVSSNLMADGKQPVFPMLLRSRSFENGQFQEMVHRIVGQLELRN